LSQIEVNVYGKVTYAYRTLHLRIRTVTPWLGYESVITTQSGLKLWR